MKDMVDIERFALADNEFRAACREELERSGCVVLEGFLTPQAVDSMCKEARSNQQLAYYCVQEHNVYLTPQDENYPHDHPRNRKLTSTKGCITADQVAEDSVLRSLYDSTQFRDFLCAVLGEDELYEYADPLSSINIHYASEGQELAWHFDNSSFAITLLIQRPEAGGDFQYIRGLRYTANGDLDFEAVQQVLDGEREHKIWQYTPARWCYFVARNPFTASHRSKESELECWRYLLTIRNPVSNYRSRHE